MTNASTMVSPIFDGFTAEEYDSTLALLEQRSYAKGDVILTEGKSEQTLWILVKGTCEVVKKNKGPAEHTLATLEAGSAFGEMSFFQKAPHSATVRASTVVKVLRMTRESYEQLQTSNPSAAPQDRVHRRLADGPAAPPHGRMDLRDGRTPGGSQPPRRVARLSHKLYSGWPF